MAYISRDPFARSELHRELVGAGNSTCDWCGSVRKGNKLYKYRTEPDAGRANEHKGLFCSKSCHDTYHL
jgi:hypothetical protein